MENEIPDIILNDAKERGFSSVLFAGMYDGVDYYYYYNDNAPHYSGLPCIVRLAEDHIEDVTDLKERLRAYDFALSKTTI